MLLHSLAHMPDIVRSRNTPPSVTNQDGELTAKTKTTTTSQDKYHYPGNRRTALVIVAYNRPDYLRRTFDSLIYTLSSPRNSVKVDIVLSQDGYLSILDGPIGDAKRRIEASLPQFSFRHIHHNQVLILFSCDPRRLVQATAGTTSSLATSLGS